MFSQKLLIVITVLSLQPSLGWAGLMNPLGVDSAQVLPKGVRNVRISTFSTQVSQKFTNGGGKEQLSTGFEKKVTWNTLTEGLSGDDGVALKGYLKGKGIDTDQEIGQTHGGVNTRLTGTVPIIGYGLTDRLTMAVAVPILYSNVNVDTGWESNGNMQSLINTASGEGIYNKIATNQSKLNNVVAAKIQSQGYKPLANETKTEMGDITLAAKYQALKQDRLIVAVQPRIVFPTGSTPDVDKVVDVASGSGHFSAGVTGIADFNVRPQLVTTLSAGYLMQLPHQAAKRIPQKGDETSSPDVDMDVRHKEGDIYSGAAGARYTMKRLYTASTGYAFQYREPDKYTGSKYSPVRYSYLEKDTEQTMHTANLGLTFSTVPLYLTKQFAVPLEASLGYSKVLAGRNVGDIELYTFEFSMFF